MNGIELTATIGNEKYTGRVYVDKDYIKKSTIVNTMKLLELEKSDMEDKFNQKAVYNKIAEKELKEIKSVGNNYKWKFELTRKGSLVSSMDVLVIKDRYTNKLNRLSKGLKGVGDTFIEEIDKLAEIRSQVEDSIEKNGLPSVIKTEHKIWGSLHGTNKQAITLLSNITIKDGIDTMLAERIVESSIMIIETVIHFKLRASNRMVVHSKYTEYTKELEKLGFIEHGTLMVKFKRQ